MGLHNTASCSNDCSAYTKYYRHSAHIALYMNSNVCYTYMRSRCVFVGVVSTRVRDDYCVEAIACVRSIFALCFCFCFFSLLSQSNARAEFWYYWLGVLISNTLTWCEFLCCCCASNSFTHTQKWMAKWTAKYCGFFQFIFFHSGTIGIRIFFSIKIIVRIFKTFHYSSI